MKIDSLRIIVLILIVVAAQALASCSGKSKEELESEKKCSAMMLQDGFSQQELQRFKDPVADFCTCYLTYLTEMRELSEKSQGEKEMGEKEFFRRYGGVLKDLEAKEMRCFENFYGHVFEVCEGKDTFYVSDKIQTMLSGLSRPLRELHPPTEEELMDTEKARIEDSLDMIRRFGAPPPNP